MAKKKKKQQQEPTLNREALRGCTERRVAELAAEVKDRESERKALDAELSELHDVVRAEASELFRYAKRRGHRWLQMTAGNEDGCANFLAAVLGSFGHSRQMASDHDLRELRAKLCKERALMRSLG